MAFGVNKNTFRDSRVRNFYCIDTNGQCSALKSLLISEGYLSGRNFYTVPAVSGCQNYNSSGCASCYSTWQQNANGSCDCNNGRHITNGKCVANTVANCNKEVSGKCTECNSGTLEQDGGCVPSCSAGYKDMGGWCNRIQYTPAEAAEVLHDDNTNSVTITFKK